ncbi:MAG: hypothetical protein PUH13_04155 [Treponema sp.]|nr:hypothetical protein [Treponema sp.]
MNIEESATKLSRNPLGIIALFILLIYGFATLLFGFVGNTFTEAQKMVVCNFLSYISCISFICICLLSNKSSSKIICTK